MCPGDPIVADVLVTTMGPVASAVSKPVLFIGFV